jgi:tetratricopeptide (TPR) repeat protein
MREASTRCRDIALAASAVWLCACFAAAGSMPEIPKADIDRLNALYSRSDVARAVEEARAFTVQYPEEPTAYHALGRLIVKSGNRELFGEAERALEKCLALHPAESWMVGWTYVTLAYLLFETDRKSEAVAYCERAIELGATENTVANARKLLHKYGDRDDAEPFSITSGTPRFTFHYRDTTRSSGIIRRVERDYERAYDRIAIFWGKQPPTPIDVYVYGGGDDMASEIGTSGHRAYPDKGEIHTTLSATPGHELTHLFAYAVNDKQANGLLIEGIATVLDQAHSRFTCDYMAARVLSRTPDASLDDVNGSVPGLDADYGLSSSFVYFLVQEYGVERFRSLYAKKGALENAVHEVYASPMADVVSGWRRRILALVRLLPVIEEMAADRRQQPGSDVLERIDEVLEGYGPAAEIIMGKGMQLTLQGRYAEAVSTLEELLASEASSVEPRYIFQWAHHYLGESYAKLGEIEKARDHLRRSIEIDDAANATTQSRALLEKL